MTEQELLEKLTGVNNPRFITPREDAIIKECLTIINEIEQQLLIHSVVVPKGTCCLNPKRISHVTVDGITHSTCENCTEEIV